MTRHDAEVLHREIVDSLNLLRREGWWGMTDGRHQVKRSGSHPRCALIALDDVRRTRGHGRSVGMTESALAEAIDLPKSGQPRTIVLTPPARDAILGLPRTSHLVFTAKRGGRLSQSGLSGYWGKVLAKADLDFDFYLATRHLCCHYMYVTLGLSERAIATQMGWSIDQTGKTIRKLLGVYGHGEIGALEEIERAFRGATVTPLHVAEEGS